MLRADGDVLVKPNWFESNVFYQKWFYLFYFSTKFHIFAYVLETFNKLEKEGDNVFIRMF